MNSGSFSKIIGCDIGGVLKHSSGDRALIPGSIESIKTLAKSFKVILISKTKDPTNPRKQLFLKDNNIEFLEVHYCEKYEEKLDLALKTNIDYMIDDRIEILSILPEKVMKLWFCGNMEKIEEWQNSEIFKKVHVVKDWPAVMSFFEMISTLFMDK